MIKNLTRSQIFDGLVLAFREQLLKCNVMQKCHTLIVCLPACYPMRSSRLFSSNSSGSIMGPTIGCQRSQHQHVFHFHAFTQIWFVFFFTHSRRKTIAFIGHFTHSNSRTTKRQFHNFTHAGQFT